MMEVSNAASFFGVYLFPCPLLFLWDSAYVGLLVDRLQVNQKNTCLSHISDSLFCMTHYPRNEQVWANFIL